MVVMIGRMMEVALLHPRCLSFLIERRSPTGLGEIRIFHAGAVACFFYTDIPFLRLRVRLFLDVL